LRLAKLITKVGECFAYLGKCFAYLGKCFAYLGKCFAYLGKCFAYLGKCFARMVMGRTGKDKCLRIKEKAFFFSGGSPQQRLLIFEESDARDPSGKKWNKGKIDW
jgi:hypothetical protein